MKPILQTAVILGLALLLSRCQAKTNTSADLMVLDLAEAVKNPETGYASAFFDEVSITVLDGKSEWFFPRHVITGVFLEKYSLFYDMHNRTSIGVFDQEGKLVISFDRKGKGPGEYTGVN